MSLNTSQWLQIAAIIIPTTITLLRWSWDAKRMEATINVEKKAADIMPDMPRLQVSWSTRIALICPLGVLAWQTFRSGELTRFDLGIMIFSCLAFLSFVSLLLASRLYTVIRLQAYMAVSIADLVDKFGGKVRKMTDVMNRIANQTQRKKDD